ncbi:MAG TPA: right-handed parallel beta-helix repeat-containing protein [Acidobacteriaceae bacterium]
MISETRIAGRAARRFAGAAALALFAVSSLSLAATRCVAPGGHFGCQATISAAVMAASPGDTILVSQGTYKESVVITKSLSLVSFGFVRAVIDATGLPNGIFINGMAAAPNAGVANVVVSGFRIRNANFEGILVANATNVTLLNNHVLDNNKALDIATPACPGIPAFETNEAEDCGEGIHLMATDHSNVVRNEVDHNSGGILISDETGPNHDNVISRNSVHDNPYDCGITTASHGPATSVIPSARLPFGIMHNTISENNSSHNGFQVPGAGAGIGIFAPFPGTTAAANVVIGNVVRDNGLPGITMHNHAWSPMAPPVNMNDNVIVGNRISRNAADTEDAATSGPTGINVYSVAPITGTIILQNVIDDEAIDVAFKAPMGQLIVHLNNFEPRSIGVDNLGTGTVDATENWWGCPTGPGTKRCATVAGTGVSWTPWLFFPFENGNHDFENGNHGD